MDRRRTEGDAKIQRVRARAPRVVRGDERAARRGRRPRKREGTSRAPGVGRRSSARRTTLRGLLSRRPRGDSTAQEVGTDRRAIASSTRSKSARRKAARRRTPAFASALSVERVYSPSPRSASTTRTLEPRCAPLAREADDAAVAEGLLRSARRASSRATRRAAVSLFNEYSRMKRRQSPAPRPRALQAGLRSQGDDAAAGRGELSRRSCLKSCRRVRSSSRSLFLLGSRQ
jgi:hypothetical protein